MGDQDLLLSPTGGVALPASLDLSSLIYKMRGLGLILQREQCCFVMVGIERVGPKARAFSPNPGLFSAHHAPSPHKPCHPVAATVVC